MRKNHFYVDFSINVLVLSWFCLGFVLILTASLVVILERLVHAYQNVYPSQLILIIKSNPKRDPHKLTLEIASRDMPQELQTKRQILWLCC